MQVTILDTMCWFRSTSSLCFFTPSLRPLNLLDMTYVSLSFLNKVSCLSRLTWSRQKLFQPFLWANLESKIRHWHNAPSLPRFLDKPVKRELPIVLFETIVPTNTPALSEGSDLLRVILHSVKHAAYLFIFRSNTVMKTDPKCKFFNVNSRKQFIHNILLTEF